jgi:primase-polymerase (primpol)-like protein
MAYANVPKELQALPQWCITLGESKAPRTWDTHTNSVRLASVTDSTTWLKFEDALFIVNHYREQEQASYLGFVFTNTDPYGCIDLDNKANLPERKPEFARLIKQADSYTELSKSGTGYHIIVRGNIGKGLRFDAKGVEIYTQGRFIIFTGDTYLQRDIINGEAILEQLTAHMKPQINHSVELDNPEPTDDDMAVVNKIQASKSCPKFMDLFMNSWATHEQDWRTRYGYKSASEADAALSLIIAFYTPNQGQGERIFKLSELYKHTLVRKKGPNYIHDTIHSARQYQESLRIEQQSKAIHFESLIAKRVETMKEMQEELPDLDPLQLRPLPDNTTGHSLANLPDGLGLLQRHIYSTLINPDMEVAGLTALSLYKAYASTTKFIDSQEGLGFNENIIILAPTSFGKESIIKVFNRVMEAEGHSTPDFTLNRSLPSSQQGLHRLLEANNHQHFIQDELGEYLVSTHKAGCKQEALGYMMECYTKAINGWVCPPQTKDSDYEAVQNPSIGLFSFSTIERALETFTSSHAHSGTYNRFVIHVCDELPQKQYLRGREIYSVPEQCLNDLDFILDRTQPEWIEFSDASWEKYIEIDQTIIMPLKDQDNCFAGRLSEQAIKDAAIFALNNHRCVMSVHDMVLAYTIRLNLYYKFRTCLQAAGGLNDSSLSSKVLQQLRHAFIQGGCRDKAVQIAHLGNWSRSYKKLEIGAQRQVVQALVTEGTCFLEGTKLRRAC